MGLEMFFWYILMSFVKKQREFEIKQRFGIDEKELKKRLFYSFWFFFEGSIYLKCSSVSLGLILARSECW